jgi:glycosyltransferase involved in cell wall biosynthesis
MTVQVLINDATLHGAARGGVARYVRHIAGAAAMHYGSRVAICSARRIAPPPSRWIPIPRFRGSGRLRVQDAVVTCAAAWLKPQLYYGSYYGSVHTSAPQVFTVYDLIHDIYAPARPDPLLRRALNERRRCFEHAAALIAISRNTAADLVRLYPSVDPRKIAVTPLGVDEIFFEPAPPGGGRKPYFLFVGVRTGYKNFRRLLEAFALSGLANVFDLVVAPGVPFTRDEEDLIRSKRLERAVALRFAVTDEALAAIYAGSAALVYPSEYEGFGLPILEAMAAGTLVACSNTSSMPEAGGNAAFYFDPNDVTSIATAMTTIARLAASERARRIEDGIRWARMFTWKECEARTMEIFDGIAG